MSHSPPGPGWRLGGAEPLHGGLAAAHERRPRQRRPGQRRGRGRSRRAERGRVRVGPAGAAAPAEQGHRPGEPLREARRRVAAVAVGVAPTPAPDVDVVDGDHGRGDGGREDHQRLEGRRPDDATETTLEKVGGKKGKRIRYNAPRTSISLVFGLVLFPFVR